MRWRILAYKQPQNAIGVYSYSCLRTQGLTYSRPSRSNEKAHTRQTEDRDGGAWLRASHVAAPRNLPGYLERGYQTRLTKRTMEAPTAVVPIFCCQVQNYAHDNEIAHEAAN